MSLMLKVMQPIPLNLPPELAPYEDEREYGIYSDIVGCHFRYYDDNQVGRTSDSPYGEAIVRFQRMIPCRPPDGQAPATTTPISETEAHEYQTHIQLEAEAFLMNEQGRTITVFRPKRPRNTGNQCGAGNIEPENDATREGSFAPSDTALKLLPYATAALIRRAARKSGTVALMGILDEMGVAVDA